MNNNLLPSTFSEFIDNIAPMELITCTHIFLQMAATLFWFLCLKRWSYILILLLCQVENTTKSYTYIICNGCLISIVDFRNL